MIFDRLKQLGKKVVEKAKELLSRFRPEVIEQGKRYPKEEVVQKKKNKKKSHKGIIRKKRRYKNR